jgi:hypothetical protein
MNQPALFETRTKQQMLEERIERLDRQIVDLLTGRTQFTVTEDQRQLLQILRMRRGKARVISIGEICERTRLTPRRVKDMVRSLVIDFGLQVGASRDGDEGGYYLVLTDEEAWDTARPYLNEAIAMFRRAEVFVGKRAILEFRGQLAITEETYESEARP